MCHGHIYRNLRYYQHRGAEKEANRWFARFTDSMQRDIARFQKKRQYRALRDAVDALLPFPGLWPRLQAGILRRIFTLRAFEVRLYYPSTQPYLTVKQECTTYVQLIYNVWSKILGHDSQAFMLVDFDTVEALQLRVLSRSLADREFISVEMENGRIFRRIRDTTIRQGILSRLLALDVTIPSLFTFLEDIKWLEVSTPIVRTLLDPEYKGSIRAGFLEIFQPPESGLFIGKGNKLYRITGSEEAVFDAGYMNLHLFAWRNWTDLGTILPRKDKDRDMPRPKSQNKLLKRELFNIAVRLGFTSDHIRAFRAQDPQLSMVRAFVQEQRPDVIFGWSDFQKQRLSNQIFDLLESDKEPRDACHVPAESEMDRIQSLEYRCGRPFDSTFLMARHSMFLDAIYWTDEARSEAFDTQRDIFRAFFGSAGPQTFVQDQGGSLGGLPDEAASHPIEPSPVPDATMNGTDAATSPTRPPVADGIVDNLDAVNSPTRPSPVPDASMNDIDAATRSMRPPAARATVDDTTVGDMDTANQQTSYSPRNSVDATTRSIFSEPGTPISLEVERPYRVYVQRDKFETFLTEKELSAVRLTLAQKAAQEIAAHLHEDTWAFQYLTPSDAVDPNRRLYILQNRQFNQREAREIQNEADKANYAVTTLAGTKRKYTATEDTIEDTRPKRSTFFRRIFNAPIDITIEEWRQYMKAHRNDREIDAKFEKIRRDLDGFYLRKAEDATIEIWREYLEAFRGDITDDATFKKWQEYLVAFRQEDYEEI